MSFIQLITGDCLEQMKNIKAGTVDMILADLPYGTTMCKWDSIITESRSVLSTTTVQNGTHAQ